MQVGILKKVDDLGRVTIPKEYRDFYHLHANEQVSVIAVQNGLLIYEPQIQGGRNSTTGRKISKLYYR